MRRMRLHLVAPLFGGKMIRSVWFVALALSACVAAGDWEILASGDLELLEELDFFDWLAEEGG